MADIHELMAAEGETNQALRELGGHEQAITEAADWQAALATCLAGRAVALAIREASMRQSYTAALLANRT